MGSTVFCSDLLNGQVALVSGGGSGIGRATALELAALGAQVVICGRRDEPLRETAGVDPAGRIDPLVCDIREEDQVATLVDTVLERHGRIDLLVNNAGGQFLAPAEQITPKGFRTVIRLNVEGTWLMTHAVATRAMIPAGSGKVVSVTLSPHNGMPGMAHSGAARAAVENLMRSLAVEWAHYGIRCNSIAPGQIGTETMLTKYPPQITERVAGTIPLGRLGTPEEIAWLVAYLASPAGDFISGTVLTVDGARDNWFGPWPPHWGTDESGKPVAEARREDWRREARHVESDKRAGLCRAVAVRGPLGAGRHREREWGAQHADSPGRCPPPSAEADRAQLHSDRGNEGDRSTR